MNGQGAYEYERDTKREQERLAAVEAAFDPLSRCFLLEAGAQPGCRCWEVGAGNGSIARWLAGVVGPSGGVLATDLDDARFDAGDTGVVFVRHDVAADPLPAEAFDLVHARFLLEHLPDPRLVIGRLRDSLRRGGAIVLEDSAGLTITAMPEGEAFHHLRIPWERAGLAVGWDATYGARLMSDLRANGFLDVRGREYRQLAPGGVQWAHVAQGIDGLGDQLLEHGATRAELDRALLCLADPANTIIGPSVTAAWGRR